MSNSVEYLTTNKDLESVESNCVVLDFTATWCGPCQMIGPEFQKLSNEDRFNHVKFFKVDVDQSPELCESFNIKCMPTFIFVKNKEKIDELQGADKKCLEEKIVKNFQLVESNEEFTDEKNVFNDNETN